MKSCFIILAAALLQLLDAHKPNIYQTGRRDRRVSNQLEEKSAFNRNVPNRGAFNKNFPNRGDAMPFPKPRIADRPPPSPQRLAGPRPQFSINLANNVPAAKTTAAVPVEWPWSGRGAGPEASPQVLVATVMTTITKFAVLTSTVTNNIIELMTKTETETEVYTRHSTRTVQVVTTSTTRMTATTTQFRTETSTIYSLVPYTVTEVETQTRTVENVILTTFTIPASTIHKTHFSTVTKSAETVILTEMLQPMIETIGTATVTATATVTSASIETVTVTLQTTAPSVKIEVEPIQGNGKDAEAEQAQEITPSEYERLVEQQENPEVENTEPTPGYEEELSSEVSAVSLIDSQYVSEPFSRDYENDYYDEGLFGNEYTDSYMYDQGVANLDDYPVSQSEQQELYEYLSDLPTGAQILSDLNGEASVQTEEAQPQSPENAEIDRKIRAAVQQWPFMGNAQRQGGRVY